MWVESMDVEDMKQHVVRLWQPEVCHVWCPVIPPLRVLSEQSARDAVTAGET